MNRGYRLPVKNAAGNSVFLNRGSAPSRSVRHGGGGKEIGQYPQQVSTAWRWRQRKSGSTPAVGTTTEVGAKEIRQYPRRVSTAWRWGQRKSGSKPGGSVQPGGGGKGNQAVNPPGEYCPERRIKRTGSTRSKVPPETNKAGTSQKSVVPRRTRKPFTYTLLFTGCSLVQSCSVSTMMSQSRSRRLSMLESSGLVQTEYWELL